ncbi:hypothetical protein [Streptomyces murinus]|uniref:hypothetical protein n=1 Tax=Streptomyces murinus TaxID=33900 RepID=UPI003F4600D1
MAVLLGRPRPPLARRWVARRRPAARGISGGGAGAAPRTLAPWSRTTLSSATSTRASSRSLTALLQEEGERELAVCAWDLRLIAECGCDAADCQSLRTAPHPLDQPYGPGHRCVPLPTAEDLLCLDVVDGRIMYVEILHRPPLRRRP